MLPSSLPIPSTSFVGRTEELSRIAALLADRDCRLLTLLGPGGIGKTRLALQVATAEEAHFPHGVVLVGLASLGSADLLASTLAAALKISSLNSDVLRVQIMQYLRDKHMLLVLDNVEHLLPETELLIDILQAAGRVKVLATSRERLNVQEEWVLALDGLSFPDEKTSESLENFSAVQLFVQRARQLQGSFSLTENADAVKTICRQVEGMPLGLELAATWLRAMPAREIAAQMEASIDFLKTPLRNVPERHRSLRAVFEQSWCLLTASEADALMHLSVFRGGFDREAAEAVAGADLTLLVGLVDKSLVRVRESGRYDLHELMRQFAADKLAEAGEAETARRHLAYFVTFAETGETHAYGREQSTWYDRLEADMDNLRVALAWSLDAGDVESGLRIAAALRWVWEMRGHYQEGFVWFSKLLSTNADVSLPIRAKALHRACEVASQLTIEPWASEWGEEALRLARELNDPWNIAWALSALTFSGICKQEIKWVAALLDESLSLFRALDDPFGLSHALRRRGGVAINQKDYATAQALIEEALTRDRAAGDKNAVAWELNFMGDIVWQRYNDPAQASPLYREALALFQELQESVGTAFTLLSLADLKRSQANYVQARAHCVEALRLAQRVGMQDAEPAVLGVAGIGGIAVAEGQLERAARLLGAVEDRFRNNETLSAINYFNDVAMLHALRDEDIFDRVWAEGKAMTMGQAVAYALQDQTTPPAPSAAVGITDDASPHHALKARELDVLRRVADGLSNREIAAQLHLSPVTVKWYLTEIYGKLAVNSRIQAVARARELRLIP
jgi:predicted ATPase/DNA-binding CsgD family transcriptional regulator